MVNSECDKACEDKRRFEPEPPEFESTSCKLSISPVIDSRGVVKSLDATEGVEGRERVFVHVAHAAGAETMRVGVRGI